MYLMHTAAQRIIRRPGKCECILEKNESKGCNHDYIRLIAHKSLIFLCYSRIFLHFRKKRSETALLLCLSCTFPGYNLELTSQREQVKRLWSSWPHSQQKTSCPRTRHHLSSPASKPSGWGWCSNLLLPPAPTIPDLLLPSSIQANPICPFLWMLISRIWSWCCQIQGFPLWKPHPALLLNLGSGKLSITHLPSPCHLKTTDKYN